MLKDSVASELLGVLKVKPASEIIRFAKKVSSLYNHIYEIWKRDKSVISRHLKKDLTIKNWIENQLLQKMQQFK